MRCPCPLQSTDRESRFAQLMSAQLLIDVDETDSESKLTTDKGEAPSKPSAKAGEAPHPEEKLVR